MSPRKKVNTQVQGLYPTTDILSLWVFPPSGMVYEEEEEISPDLWQEACWIVIRLDRSGECSKIILKILIEVK